MFLLLCFSGCLCYARKLQQDLATSEKTQVEKTEDLKDAEDAKAKLEDYLLKIKPGCDFITTNFDTREATYMAMEGYFHQQVCPNIDKNTQHTKMHVGHFQGRHFCQKKAPARTLHNVAQGM
jgi:hypothetical protein